MSHPSITQTTEVELVEAAATAAYDFIDIHGTMEPDFCLLTAVADIFYHIEAGVGGSRWSLAFKTNDDHRQVVQIAIVTNHHDGVLCAPYLAYVSMAHVHLLDAIIGQLELLASKWRAA